MLASSEAKMSFQRITTIGSMPLANSEAIASRLSRSPSFSRRWISTSAGPTSLPVRSPRSALRDLLAGADEHVAHAVGLLHRRLDVVDAERVGGLLGVVDDVVERGRQRVAVGEVERRADLAGAEPVDDVVRDPVALVLADHEVVRELGALGVVVDDVAQQHRRALDVAAGLLEQVEERRGRSCGAGTTSSAQR